VTGGTVSTSRAPVIVAGFIGPVPSRPFPAAASTPSLADDILDEAGNPIQDEAGNPIQDEG
jgi:hypothetical protein